MNEHKTRVAWAEAVYRRACDCFDTLADSSYQRHKNMERIECARSALRANVIMAEANGVRCV